MLNKLNKIKKSQLPTMVINTHNELLYKNSNLKTCRKKLLNFNFFFFFWSITQFIQVLFLLIFFHLSFLMTPLNKILGAPLLKIVQNVGDLQIQWRSRHMDLVDLHRIFLPSLLIRFWSRKPTIVRFLRWTPVVDCHSPWN